jgi:DNA-binding XRE family transcriptional regulator
MADAHYIQTPAQAKQMLADIGRYIDAQASEVASLRQHSMAHPFDEISERIQATRKKQGLTLEGLASLSEVSMMTLSKIERGNLNVNMDTVLKVTRALGMSLWIV